MKRSIAKLRVEYGNTPLLEEDLLFDPLVQFEKWLEEAIHSQVVEPNGMTLATVSELSHPSTRTVLLKEIDQRGFVFFTDYRSRKSGHLKENPHASLTFWWKEIYRQVNIEGTVKKVSRKETLSYFQKRPKGAQLAANASLQSEPLATRLELEERYFQLSKAYQGKPVPCPKNWGGYRLVPERIEFWQGRKNRLHDRFLYVRVDKDWVLTRLYP